ncbi:uncharacterized protein LOC124162325 [Ischnura elegans]|uniref:uncharacterized protein LOC124162325 n=1 Tax=Ischnura elegans TaxID=197161 RepID=UPI001ED88230|nr:uncharacterized protein LOC124162325 [Ischnura elegans]
MAAPGLLVIGASQWKYASMYAHQFPGFDVTIISNSGMGVHEVSESMVLATSFFNDVVLHLGTNNLICGQSPEEVVSHYAALVETIYAGNPSVRLHISSVLLRGQNRFRPESAWEENRIQRMNIKIERLNLLLRDFASRHGAYFINNWEKFKETAWDPFHKLLSRDGLHLSPDGVQCLLGNVITFCLQVRYTLLKKMPPTPCLSSSNPSLLNDSNFPPLSKVISKKPNSSFVVRPASVLTPVLMPSSSILAKPATPPSVPASVTSKSIPVDPLAVPTISGLNTPACSASQTVQTITPMQPTSLGALRDPTSVTPNQPASFAPQAVPTTTSNRLVASASQKLPASSNPVKLASFTPKAAMLPHLIKKPVSVSSPVLIPTSFSSKSSINTHQVPTISISNKQASFAPKAAMLPHLIKKPVSVPSPVLIPTSFSNKSSINAHQVPTISVSNKQAAFTPKLTHLSHIINKPVSLSTPVLINTPSDLKKTSSAFPLLRRSKCPSISSMPNKLNSPVSPPTSSISLSHNCPWNQSTFSSFKAHLKNQECTSSPYNIPVSNRWSVLETVGESLVPNVPECSIPYQIKNQKRVKHASKLGKPCKKHPNSTSSLLTSSRSLNFSVSSHNSHEKISSVQLFPRHTKVLPNISKISNTFSCKNCLQNEMSSSLSYHSPIGFSENSHCFKTQRDSQLDSKILCLTRGNCSNYRQSNGGSDGKGSCQTSIYPRMCDTCSKTYQSRSTFFKHKRTCGKVDECVVYPRVCPICHVSYSNKSNFSRHKKTCQPLATKFISCPHSECEIQFHTQSALVNHLQSYHKEDILVQNFTFKDISEFLLWKKEQCEKNNLSYVKHSGEIVNGDCSTQYFICKFDNNHKKDTVSNKTSRKRKYGLMPNTNCSSRMIVKEKGSEVHVKYISAHNHGLEFKNVLFYRWEKSTKIHINNLLEQGVPALTIQETLQPPNSDFEGIIPVKEHFITTHQINKMKYELNLKKRLHKDDAVAVHLLVYTMNEECRDSILIYKPLGKPVEIGSDKFNHVHHNPDLFVLGIQNKQQKSEIIAGCSRILCIDSTHDTNQYKFHLLNFITPDEYGVGYPVAHFITNHLDEQTLVCILKSLVDKCPNLIVNAVMTDGDEALGNAVANVFGPKVRHLLCSWHVKRNWQRNLHRKVKNNDELISEVYENLETLIDEKNEKLFTSMLEAFISKYSPIAFDFVEYFKNVYCSKVEKWAMCFRNFPHADTDTNMFVEAFHNKLKTHYLNRKVNRRLDDLINVLQRIQKSCHFNLMFKRMTEEPPLGFQQQLKGRHWKGMKILDEDVVKIDDRTWNIRSQSDSSVKYNISCISPFCNIPHLCFIKCCETSCWDLCCHMYICSCSDQHSLCKHVHKVHSLTVRNQPPKSDAHNPSAQLVYKSIPFSTSNEEVDSSEEMFRRFTSLSDRLKSLGGNGEITILLPYLNNSLQLLIEKCESLLLKNVNCPVSLEHETIPPNSKLSPQCKLFQTIKDREVTAHRFKKPDVTRRSEIRRNLLGEGTGGSFTDPIMNDCDLSRTLFSTGPFSINMIHLKSLDYFISDTVVNRLQAVAKDFRKGWLYDTIIGAFLYKICAIDEKYCCIDPAVSQFVAGSVSFETLKLSFRKLHLKGYSHFIIPLNANNSHWTLLVADRAERQLFFYDPITVKIDNTYSYVVSRWIDFLKFKLEDYSGNWNVSFPDHTTQKDSHSCGVYISWYAERILLGESVTEPFNPSEYRKYMYDVLTGHTLDESYM